MIHCPSCGHENAESALVCAQCGRALRLTSMDGNGQPPEPMEAGETTPAPPFTPPVQLPGAIAPGPLYEMRPMPPPLPFRQPPLTGKQKTARYFIGIGLGFLPVLVAIAFVSIGGGIGGDIAGTLYSIAIYAPCLLSLVVLGLMIYFLTQERLRPIGYGLLTVIVALPVIAGVSCIVLLSNSSF